MNVRHSYLRPDGSVPQIFIIEGVPGSGKDTFIRNLLLQFDQSSQPVYDYVEDAVLWSWKHFYLPHIQSLRIAFLESMVIFMKQQLLQIPDVVFIFNRFHLSCILAHEPSLPVELEGRYSRVLTELEQLPVLNIITFLTPEQMYRVRHADDRKELIWQRFLERRSLESGSKSPEEHYARYQDRLLDLATQHNIPYQVLQT